MSEQITQWAPEVTGINMIAWPKPGIDTYVKYADHLAVVTEKDAVIQQLRDVVLAGHHVFYKQVAEDSEQIGKDEERRQALERGEVA